MCNREINSSFRENFKHIEDIIDSRKLLGQYNVQRTTNVHSRYVYSQPILKDNLANFDDSLVNEGDSLINSNIKKTDSEVTVVRVKISEATLKRRRSKWDMEDIAIPGDGSHLGESPSLVNLVTLVGDTIPFEGEEYLVPISSWDPYVKFEDRLNYTSDTNLSDKMLRDSSLIDIRVEASTGVIGEKSSWPGKIYKFLRRNKEPNFTNKDGAEK